MNAFAAFLREVMDLLCDTAPFLLVGFLIAGLMKVFLPAKLIYGKLGKNDLLSVLRASLYGVPIPLCSCSVLPTAASLKANGASKGATASFLISTPETGVDSISVTWALLDPLMTVLRPVVAFVTAATTGTAVNIMVRRGWDTEETGEVPEDEHHHHDHDHAGHADHADDCCGDGTPSASLGARLVEAVRYGYVTIFDDLTPWLVLGFALSALISMLVPDSFFVETVPAGWPAMLLMLLVATPVYICATASTPVAAVLIAKGLDPGAALVFLLVGPATNATTLLVVSRMLGRRALWAYLGGITGVALLAGVGVNFLYAALDLDLAATVGEALESAPGPIALAGGAVFAVLLVASALRVRLVRQWNGRAVAALTLVLWIATAFTPVQPGETGWVLRFGAAVRELDEPGWHVHLPWPIDVGETVEPGRVRSVSVGLADEEDPPPRGFLAAEARRLEDASEVMAGDGTLLRINYTVHYAWEDARRVRFGLEDPDALVRSLAETSVRRAVADRPGEALLVVERARVAERTSALLAEELRALASGLRLVSVNVREVHAPADVHTAYRDVASALEDRVRTGHDAHRELLLLGGGRSRHGRHLSNGGCSHHGPSRRDERRVMS